MPTGALTFSTLDREALGVLLKSRGLHMPRSKYQRPEVYAWTGKSGQKFWKAEWRVYIEGRPKPKHRAMTWPVSDYTKAKAQQECDRVVREETGGALRPDGSITVTEFWEKVFYPTVSSRLARNSKINYESAWHVYIQPAIGSQELQHVLKHAIEGILARMAASGKGWSAIQRVKMLVHELFTEAVENNYIVKNPARHVMPPRCKPAGETEALTEQQVRTLFEKTEGRDRLLWQVLLLTGMRPGELYALRKNDLLPAGIQIDESADQGKPSTTKNQKTRYAPIPQFLREDLERWCASTPGDLVFPNHVGTMYCRQSDDLQSWIARARTILGLPKFTLRQCRTTFATLFDGDPKDRQAILGHHSEAFTRKIYQKAIAARQQASVEELAARLTSPKVVEIKKRA